MLASTKNDNEKVVSARGPDWPILKCYMYLVSVFSWIQFSRRSIRPSSGYNLFIIILRWQHLPSRFKLCNIAQHILLKTNQINLFKSNIQA